MTLNPEELIPIRPICAILGLDYSRQVQKIKKNEDLSSVMVLSTTTGPDGKEYETPCLPLKYVAGWLFPIKDIKSEYQEFVYASLIPHYHALCEEYSLTEMNIKHSSFSVEEGSGNLEKLIPIRPICEMLGLDYSSQVQKIKEDENLSSVVGISPTTEADGKEYEDLCLPLI
ncbi:hypothetical protein EZS27_024541 [termite gut metagenome]|uniref:Antirepressor protein ant N-terminal domain-containing protein n=1 Tax=termite gut metagenome TaxID=433724 RepID=A0A5J4QWW0_9ZZZZ